MKVIGKSSDSSYLCEIDHSEIEKYLGTFYGKTKPLRIGQEVDLGLGYDYRGEMRDALDKTKKFIESNKKIIEAIMNGLTITSINEEVVE